MGLMTVNIRAALAVTTRVFFGLAACATSLSSSAEGWKPIHTYSINWIQCQAKRISTDTAMSWLQPIARDKLPAPSKAQTASAVQAATDYLRAWSTGHLAAVVGTYARDSHLLHCRLKSGGRVIDGNEAAVKMLTTYTKHNQNLQVLPRPSVYMLNNVTYGQAVVLLALELDGQALLQLKSGDYQISGRIAFLGVKSKAGTYLLTMEKQGNKWMALQQPFSLQLPKEMQ